MRLKTVTILSFCLFYSAILLSQIQDYNYQRDITGISQTWHSIPIPDAIFSRISSNFRDVRIYGITEKNDTIEAPYKINPLMSKKLNRQVDFKILNTSYNENGYFFTFQTTSSAPINHIDLDFKEQNFDWKLKLEGSHDQKNWYTIVDNYRVLSIKNRDTDFKFTKINFPESNYHYYRIRVDSKQKPNLILAGLFRTDLREGSYKSFPTKSQNITENKQSKQTIIEIELEQAVPISELIIKVSDDYDYYRKLKIQYLRDSFETEKGWKYNYANLTQATLNSLVENKFDFMSRTTHKINLIIDNMDNEPLHVESITVRGYSYELIARFTEPAKYHLVYGNRDARLPRYDIDHFLEEINDRIPITLGPELKITKEEGLMQSPLFKNKAWLWAIMIITILMLGWASLSMMRNKQ